MFHNNIHDINFMIQIFEWIYLYQQLNSNRKAVFPASGGKADV